MEANNGQETAQLTSLPGVTTGTLAIHAPTSLWGLGGNLRCLLCCGCNYRITALAGFRNVNLDESLTITENIQGLPTAPQPFTNQMITVNDSFATQNHFYGGNLGADVRYYWGRWSVDVRGQVALGDNVQILDISGSQRFVSPTGVVQNFTGGLLALPSNIGHFTNNAFSVIPQMGVNVGYQIPAQPAWLRRLQLPVLEQCHSSGHVDRSRSGCDPDSELPAQSGTGAGRGPASGPRLPRGWLLGTGDFVRIGVSVLKAACGLARHAKPQAAERIAQTPIYFAGRIFGNSLTMASMSLSFSSPFLKAWLALTMCLV